MVQANTEGEPISPRRGLRRDEAALYIGVGATKFDEMVADGRIRVVQQKTGARLVITAHPDLKAILDAAPTDHVTILTTAYGKPFSVKGFGQFLSAAIAEAGLPSRCKAHGLRKAAARRLAEAERSAIEIMAVTGHKTLAEVEHATEGG